MKKAFFTLALMLVAFTANAQSCPDNKHPHMIDLGLPSGTKWACCNIGAEKPEGYGGYYAWGETQRRALTMMTLIFTVKTIHHIKASAVTLPARNTTWHI